MKTVSSLFGTTLVRKTFVYMTAIAVIFSSFGPSVFRATPVHAAATIAVSTSGLINDTFSNTPIKASSAATAILKLSVTASATSKTLTSVTVNFSGTGFATGDLASIATGASSGVALYDDAGSSAGSFDGSDAVVTLAASPDWTPSTTNITLTPASAPALTNGSAAIFYVVIKTSGTISENDVITAAVATNGIVTTDGNGPTSAFTANSLRGDVTAPTITAVEGYSGSTGVTIVFSEPVTKVGGGNVALGDTPLTFTDNGTSGGTTISTLTHTAGHNIINLVMSSATDSGDLDGSPSTMAAGSNKISDFAGNAVGTSAVNMTSPLKMTTNVIPATFVGQVTDATTPLVQLAATGGTTPYTFAANAAGDTTTLSNLGLAIASTGKITGTTASVSGSFNFTAKVTDSAGSPVTFVKSFTINVAASSGAGVPGLSSVAPPGGAQSSTVTITITGANTAFTGSSTVAVSLPPNTGGTNGITVGAVTTSSGTSISVPLTIAANASAGARDVSVTTGTQTVTLPGGFGLFAAATGLALQFPSNNATNIMMPPGFSFNPTSNSSVNSYRIILKNNANFSGSALWDYTFPKPADAQNTNGSHCSSTMCGIGYGNGAFRIITQPTPLAPNTVYYWQVKTYSETTANVSDSVASLEATPVFAFTTTSSLTDTMPPQIMHRTIFQATESAAVTPIARVVDNIATLTSSPALSAKMYFCVGNSSCSPTTEVVGTSLGNGYFKFPSSSNIGAVGGNVLRYYLKASDGTNDSFFGSAAAPNTVTPVTAGAASITGFVKDSANTCPAALQSNVTLFAEGTSSFTTFSSGTCAFTLSNIPAGPYDLVALQDGYADKLITGIPSGSTGITFKLSAGITGGFGGDTTKPRVKFTGPMDGSTFMPGNDSNFKIFVTFDKAMSQQSINTAGNLTVNEVNLSTGALTDITTTKGAWVYYNTAPASGSGLPNEANMAAWSLSGSNTLGDNKTIAIVVSGNVTDTNGNSIMGNNPDGSYSFSFTTSSTSFTGTFTTGQSHGSGAFTPPYIKGTTPTPGAFNVPLNSKIVVEFSEAMANDGGGYTLASQMKLFTVGSNGAETDVTSAAAESVTLDTSKLKATVALKSTYNSGQFLASTKYLAKVLGGAKAASGITLMPPGQETMPSFMVNFNTGTTADTGAPNIVGSFPDASAISVPVNTGAVSIGFSKDMDASTLTTSTVTLAVGSSTVNGTVEYRNVERQAYFVPKTPLTPNTTYTLAVTTSAKGLNGVAVAGTSTQALSRTFTTGAADTVVPRIEYINASDFGIAITFSESLNAAKATDSLKWPTSILNPAVYNVVKYGATGFDPSSAGTAVSLSAATFTFDAPSNTLGIKGLAMTAAIGQELYISMDISGTPSSGAQIVTDLAGNAMTSAGNTARAPIKSSASTGGNLGPGAGTTSTFNSTGTFTPTNFSTSTFGFAPPIEVRPFNMNAGQTTIYGVRIPISSQIPTGGTVTLSFPTGFDVSGAMQDIKSPMRTDVNGPGTGTVTFKCQTNVASGKSCGGGVANSDDTSTAQGGLADDGVVVNSSARTITVYLNGATNSAGNDFLMLDIAGIKNSTVPKDFNTSGYTVDIKTKNSSTLIESLTSNPFYIQAGGSFTLSGTITATGNDQSGTMKVYISSPMNGFVEATSSNFATTTTATYSITGLSAGQYMLWTDSAVTLGTKEFVGKSGEQVNISANTTLNFTMGNTTTGTAVTVAVDGPSGEKLDVFAGGPGTWKLKQVTLDSSAGSENFTLNLPVGKYFVGVGPQMATGMQSGPPPAPTYLPPKPIDVEVTSGGVLEASGTANDGTVAFTLTSSTKQIKGLAKDGSGKVMASAQVFAYSPQGGMGTYATTDTAGAFTLNVVDGSYVVGAFVPGMPPSKEVQVTVTSHATTYLLIDGSSTAITPAAAATSFVLKIAKPDYTISGKITDGTNVIQGASVYAYRTDGPGHGNAVTDSSGEYTVYVTSGTWKVGVFLPQYGQLPEQTVTVTTSSQSNINFSPTTAGTYYTVSGRIYRDANSNSSYDSGEELAKSFVRINGNSTSNETITGATGTYSFSVPSGNGYVVRAFNPTMGELPPTASFNVTANVSNKDIVVTGAANTITVTMSAAAANVMVEFASQTTEQKNRVFLNNATSATTSLPNGSYRVYVNSPNIPFGTTDVAATTGDTVYSNSTGVVTVNGNEGLTITVPTLRTISGTVTDGTTAQAEAWVDINNPTTGVRTGAKTNSSGAFTVQLPNASSSYVLNAMKPGYVREPSNLSVTASVANSALTGLTLAMTASSITITGQLKVGSTGIANGFVRAEKQGGGFSGAQADASGNYTLYVSAGTWTVYGVAEGYAEQRITQPITITTASVTGQNITLSTLVTLDAPITKPITPSSGGTITDTSTGVFINVPANAFGSSSSAATLSTKETNNVRETASAKPVAGKAKEIKAVDSAGTPITTLSEEVTIELDYTLAELAATESSSDSSINTKAEADKLKMGYWDETTQNWLTLPTTVSYEDSSGNPVTAASDLSNVTAVVVSALTDHFSLYAPIVATDANAPSTPTGFAVANTASSQVNLQWTAVSGATSYDIYRSTSSTGTFTRIGSEPTVSSGSTTTYSDTGLSASTAYFYQITALNNSGESAASSTITTTTTGSGASQSGGGGGGGGGGAVAAPVTTTPTVTQPTTTEETKKTETKTEVKTEPTKTTSTTPSVSAPAAAPPSTSAPAAAPAATVSAKPSIKFDKLLSRGAQGVTVKALQQFLKDLGPEVYPDGIVNGNFGPATTTAVGRLQEKYGIAKPGEAGYGTLGPKTRAFINGFGGSALAAPAASSGSAPATTSQAPATTSGAFKKNLSAGTRGADVSSLQDFLKSQGAEIYPEGTVSGYYGPATKAAIQRFQEKHGIAKPGEQGYGSFGPKTREKMNSMR